MSDYSKDAIDALLNGKELNLILFGHTDLCLIDAGEVTMREAVRAKLRYAANYGQPFYPLETYLNGAKQESAYSTTKDTIAKKWNILVEGEQDVRTIQALLDRFEISAQYSVIPAGGQLAIAQLAESISKNNTVNVATIITPLSNPEKQQEQINKLKALGAEVIVLSQEIEGWLESFVSADYYNATLMFTNRNRKMARRYAHNSDLDLLLSNTPSFSTLVEKMGGKEEVINCITRSSTRTKNLLAVTLHILANNFLPVTTALCGIAEKRAWEENWDPHRSERRIAAN